MAAKFKKAIIYPNLIDAQKFGEDSRDANFGRSDRFYEFSVRHVPEMRLRGPPVNQNRISKVSGILLNSAVLRREGGRDDESRPDSLRLLRRLDGAQFSDRRSFAPRRSRQFGKRLVLECFWRRARKLVKKVQGRLVLGCRDKAKVNVAQSSVQSHLSETRQQAMFDTPPQCPTTQNESIDQQRVAMGLVKYDTDQSVIAKTVLYVNAQTLALIDLNKIYLSAPLIA